jgi:hypothetical protein
MSTKYWTGTNSALIGAAPSKRISHPTGWEVVADDASVVLFLGRMLENNFMVTRKNSTIAVMVEK